jgi:hypothetical protein
VNGRRASSRMQVEAFTADRVAAVRDFNSRLAAAGAPWHFPEDPVPTWLPRTNHSPVFQEYFLLTQGEQVRGAYVLKHHPASLGGELVQVGSMYWPVSEGAIDRAYALVGRELVQDALRREPLVFCVGLEGDEAPIARLLRALGWRLAVVPFHFKVLNGTRFLRELRYLRSTRLRRWALDLAAISGAGWVGAKLANYVLTRRPDQALPVAVDIVDEFGAWADELWRECKAQYSFLSLRDSVSLNSVFPRGKPGFVRLMVTMHGRVVGLSVLRDARNPEHPSFGDLRLGTIADCLARPEHADAVIRASTSVLEQRGVDLVVSNQFHPAWRVALGQAGFLSGPSTCGLAVSGRLTDLLAGIDPGWKAVHVNRGDGDYPWGLTVGMRAERDQVSAGTSRAGR